ncbi:MAG: sulfatase-like hydrolase/transferase [Phycisphaerae bacterium]|nr:sulfatase-like hydrolase/transferase [Phycisphaerae bacterium]
MDTIHPDLPPVTRRLLPLALLLSFGAAPAQAEQARAAPVRSRPNIVLILADDMGPGEPSYAGGLIPTPALDRMATEGMRFTDAHTSSSVCTPTRYGILTGRYNWRSRLKSGVLHHPTDRALMDPKRPNLASFLQRAGYHTACIGKWHLGADWVKLPRDAKLGKDKGSPSWRVDYTKAFRNGPVDLGFNEAFFILSSLDMAPYVYLRNDRAVTVPTVNKGFRHNEYNKYQRIGAAAEDFEASNCLADWAAESRSYIRRRAEDASKKPFFLYLPLTSPHTPIAPGKAFKGKHPQYSWYADFMAETDWVVAEVLEQIKQSGLDDSTLVIFTSDNGFAPYVKIPKMLAAGYRPSGPYRGAKATIYEGGHRVPFLVRWPGRVAAGSTCDVTICTTDFLATFAELLGRTDQVPDSAAEDSFSFYPCLGGSTKPVRPFTIHHSISGQFAIRKADWKLIMTRGTGGGWGLPGEKTKTSAKLVQLYNLKDDPGETANLEEARPRVVRELVDDLARALHDGRTTPGEKQTNEGWPYRDKATKKAFPQLHGK